LYDIVVVIVHTPEITVYMEGLEHENKKTAKNVDGRSARDRDGSRRSGLRIG
jgi:hypothetical protein